LSVTPKKVGLQVGHWRREEAPAPFNRHTGSSGRGLTEAEVNLRIAELTAELLRRVGHEVELLPTWFPAGYRADVVVAIHADGAASPAARGFFADRPARSRVAEAEARLVAVLNKEYAAATGIPHVYRGNANTRYYYGYDRVHPETPMVLIECGFLTSPVDQRVLVDRPDLAAQGLAGGIAAFLES
jgi:N-acetylmuramoyl-L-alanine amidase